MVIGLALFIALVGGGVYLFAANGKVAEMGLFFVVGNAAQAVALLVK